MTGRRSDDRLARVETALDTHLKDCFTQHQAVEKRLWRVEWLIIGSASAIIGLLVKLAFFAG